MDSDSNCRASYRTDEMFVPDVTDEKKKKFASCLFIKKMSVMFFLRFFIF